MIWIIAYLVLGFGYVLLDVSSVWGEGDGLVVPFLVTLGLTPVWPAWILWKKTR